VYDRLHTEELGSSTQGLISFASKMKGTVTGIETWGSYQPSQTWRLSAGFTGLYERFRLDPGSTDMTDMAKVNGRDPAQTWLLRSSWDLPHGHEFDATVRHVSRLRDPDVPAYMALDARWGWHATPALELSLTGRNLLGSGHGEYDTVATRTELDRSLYVQALVRF
jgi:iron complex outermembrane receptor protein